MQCHMAPSSSLPSPGLCTAATCQQKSCYSIISPTGPAARLGEVSGSGSEVEGWTDTAKIQAVFLVDRPLPVAGK